MTDGQSRKSVTDEVSDRRLRRWGDTAEAVARMFDKSPGMTYTFDEIHRFVVQVVQEMSKKGTGSKTSEEAVEGVLKRFVKKHWLSVRRRRYGRFTNAYYSATDQGRLIFAGAHEYFKEHPRRGSLTNGEQWGLHMDTIRESAKDMTVHLKSWREVLAMDSGWNENTRITRVYLDPFIIKNIRSVIGQAPKGGNKAEWLSVWGKLFKMQVSKRSTLQFWVYGPGWRDELREWLQNVPNLEERHMDQIWNRIHERCKLTTTTREYHVSEPRMTEGNVHLFRQVDIEAGRGRRYSRLRAGVGPIARQDGGPHLRASRQRRRRLHALGRRIRRRLHLLPSHEGNAGGVQGGHSAPGAHSHPRGRATIRGEQRAPQGIPGVALGVQEEEFEAGGIAQ